MHINSVYFAVAFPVEVAQTESFVRNAERLAETKGADFAIIRTYSDRLWRENNGPLDANARQPQHPIALLLMHNPARGKYIEFGNGMANFTRVMGGARGTRVPVAASSIRSFIRRTFPDGVATDDYIALNGYTFAAEAINNTLHFDGNTRPIASDMAREQRHVEIESLEALHKHMPKDLFGARAFYAWPSPIHDALLTLRPTYDQLCMVCEFMWLCGVDATVLDSWYRSRCAVCDTLYIGLSETIFVSYFRLRDLLSPANAKETLRRQMLWGLFRGTYDPMEMRISRCANDRTPGLDPEGKYSDYAL